MLDIAKAKFEGDTAKHERQQHHQDWKVDCRNDDGESEREGGKESEAPHDEPRLVSVPDWRDRIHHDVARRGIRREPVKHADPEVEAVEQHVEEDRHPEDQRPDRHEVEDLSHGLAHCPPPPAIFPPANTGALGRPPSIGPSSSGAAAGPLSTMRHMRSTPAGYMNR